MRFWTTMKSAGVALSLGVAAGAASASGNLDDAMLAYENGRYLEAHKQLLVAANDGNAQAQEIVGFMYAFGPHLYPGVGQDLRSAALWFGRAAKGGRPVARHMECVLARRGVSPGKC